MDNIFLYQVNIQFATTAETAAKFKALVAEFTKVEGAPARYTQTQMLNENMGPDEVKAGMDSAEEPTEETPSVA